MTAILMPYGSAENFDLVTKVGVAKTTSELLPYGAADNAVLTAKVLIEGKFCSDPSKRRVVRLKSGKR